jgi:hypothetical protein
MDLITQCPNAQNPACDQLFDESHYEMKKLLTKKCIQNPTLSRCQNILDRSLRHDKLDARKMIIECGNAMNSGIKLTSHCTTFVKRVNNELICTQFHEKCTEKANKMESGGAIEHMIKICRGYQNDENCKDVLHDMARLEKGWAAIYHQPDILAQYAGHSDEPSQQAIAILTPVLFDEIWSIPEQCTRIFGSIVNKDVHIVPCLRSEDPACLKAIENATAFIESRNVKNKSELSYKDRFNKQEFLTRECLEVIKGQIEQSGNPSNSKRLFEVVSNKLTHFKTSTYIGQA